MRNPLSNFQTPSWMKRALARLRNLLARASSLAARRGVVPVWVAALSICVLLVGSIAILRAVHQRHSSNNVKAASATLPATNSEAAPSDVPRSPEKAIPTKVQPPPSAKRGLKAAKHTKPGLAKPVLTKAEVQSSPVPPSPPRQIFLSPPVSPAGAVSGEKENSDIGRARASWFFDQRAYPFKHIPSGAFQKAIEQRNLMRQQQRATFKAAPGANAIISFPGDALWHLMGPQPIDEPFTGTNTGYPTASGRVTAIAVDPSDATGNTVYIGGAAGGVWKTTDGGTTWAALTDTQPSLAIGSIAIDPNSCSPAPCKTIYVGTGEENFNGDAFYGAGILKSVDAGATWSQLGTSTFAQVLTPSTGGAYIGSIAVQPGNANIVLAAVSFFVNGTVGGIYRSTDAGVTWNEDAAPRGLGATSVFFESTSNSGTTAIAWMAMGDPFPVQAGEAANGIYKSTDSGATWTLQAGGLPTTNLGRITLGYAPSTAAGTATVYAAIADSSTTSSNLLGLFKTTNGGTTWASLTGPAGGFCNAQCFYDMAIGVHPTIPNDVVIGGGAYTDNFTSLFESTDGGATWTGTGAGNFSNGSTTVHPHVDTHAIVFTSNGAKLYVGNDGGVWSTTTPTPAAGVSPTWVDLNGTGGVAGGLAITQFYPGISAAISDDNYGFGGTQDNDTEIFSGTLDWLNAFTCGDGGFTAVDTTMPTTVYTGCNLTAAHVVQKSVFNGTILGGTTPTFNPADTGITTTEQMEFIPPLILDENNPSTLYFGTCHLWQTINGASTWTAITGDLASGTNTLGAPCGSTNDITTMDVSHQSSGIVFAGTSNGKVWKTLNATSGPLSTWTEFDNGLLPPRHVTAVRTERSDTTGNVAFVTFSGFGSCTGCGSTPGHVFATTNGGTSWTNISGDLPDIPVNDLIVYHQGSPTYDALYIATDVGVFSCPSPATTLCTNWTVIGDGLPNSPVLGLSMRRSSRILHAATHGRSMWQIQLTDVSPLPLASLSSLTPAAVMVGAATTPVTAYGLNFSANTQVLFDGVSVGTPTFVSTTQLTISVNSSLLTNGHVYTVTLSDPAGTDNGSQFFTVMNPILNATGMSPSTTTTYTPVTLTFTGTNFVSGTAVTFNNVPLTGGTVTGGGTGFTVPVPALLLTTPATVNVTITNPLPGGGPTPPTTFPFTITANPGPIALVVPSPIVLGPIALGTNTSLTTLQVQNPGTTNALNITNATITGTNAVNFAFVAPTSAPTCTFESTHTVTVAAGGSCFFGITYTAGTPPGLAISNATLNLTDNAAGSPQPTQIVGVPNIPIVVLTPVNFGAVGIGTTSATMNATLLNSTGASLNVTATGFTIAGTNAADFHVVAAAASTNPACPAAPFALAANAMCDVGVTFTPSNAGNETASINVTDNGPGSPQNAPLLGIGVEITSISPSIVASGGPAFTLTVNGGGFASSAVVNVGPNGTNPRLTTFVNANQLLASIPASDIAAAGSLPISVTTPNPGGTASEPKTLVIAQAPVATNDNINFATNASTTPFRSTQDTTQATVNTGGVNDPAPACAPGTATQSGKARSVWFKFVAAANGRIVVDTRFSSYTTILSAWTGTPGSLVAVAGACASGNVPAAGASPAQSLIGFNVTSGTTYFMMVTDAGTSAAGGTLTFSLDSATAAPANDDNATPTVISATPFSSTVNSILATVNTNGHADPALPAGCATGAVSSGQANSVWYSFTPSSGGTITADTLTSPYETILNVTSGTPTGTQVACNQSAGSGIAQSQVSFAATSGTHYFFMVSAFLGDGGTTNFHLTFSTGASNPVPTITSLSPSSTTAGGAAFTLTINGTNFVSGATGTFNGAARTVTFVSATQVTMAVTAADIAAAGSFPVIVSNPAPGGGASAPSAFTVNNPIPTTTSISPTSATAGGAAFTLTVNGTNFNASSVVNFNGAGRTTTFVSATQVTAAITAADIATAGTFPVTVTNPAPGGGISGSQSFTVNNPLPTITSLSPNGATAGGAAFTLTVNGTGFVSTSSVKFNGNARTTTFVSATQVTAAITAADIATAGSFPVTVTNPTPGGGTSASVSFNVSVANNPVPTLTSISPTSATAGGAAFTLTLTGTNFVASSVVNFGANPPLTPTSQTATQLQVTVPAADIALGTGGTVNVSVTNPAPGGGTSGTQLFTISNPPTTLTSLSPSSATAGGAAFTLTINGTNFVSGATGTFNGSARTVTFVSSTQVTMAVTAADIATAGSFPVVVSNPAPGGGTIGGVSFTVNNVVPTISSLSPSSATAGGAAFTLTVNGTGFVSSSTVKFGVVAPITTFVSATQLTAAITAADIATAGTFPVTVTNPAPGGGTSTAVNFTVNNPVPTITSLSPASATAGGAAFTLTINGTNFISGATGTFNGTARTITFVSATQVTMAVTAADITTAGIFPVIVSNPAPGGGASAASNFTVNNPAPTVTSLSPTSATAGGAAFTLTVNGTGFVSTSSVKFNGSARTTTFVSATQLTAAITAADIATAGTFPVTVTNPAPGGGTSTATNFTVNNPVPTITSLSPTSATAGGAAFTLTINGTNFVSGATGTFNGAARTVAFVSATQVTMAVTAADIATAGSFPVVVSNPAPGGGASAASSFTVNNPAPTITSLSPTGATAGGTAFTLTVNGTGFVSSSSVKFNGTARTTTFVSATQLTAAILASDIATAGSANVTVTNPAPGGGTSTAAVFNIASAPNPVPTLTSISPTSATAGGAAFTLTVNGTNYVSSSVVNFNGSARTTTVVSATQLTAAITAADIATAGSFPITVFNPAPGGGTSSAINLTVNNPVPAITTLSPVSATVGGPAFTLAVNGTNFVSGATVNFNGAARTTTFVSATQVTAAITAADIAAVGSFPVTVTNPAPGGGTSAAVSFAVNNPAPTITSLSPSSATAGGAAFTLTVNGTNFVAASVVNFNGAAKATTFVSATQLTAAITAADIATAGVVNVTVTNPAPGGGNSANAAFTINNPAPTITTIAPTSATAGGAALTLTVNGTNFVATSVVSFNGAAKTTTFVSATQLTAAITAADIAAAGTFPVTVTNPAPGGGTSAATNFTVNNPVPTITSLSPSSATAGGAAFTLTVNGTNFVSKSVVNFNGAAKTTTFVSATQITAAVTAADIAAAGSFPVTVTNPAPGGGTSAASNFTVNNPAPAITSLSPASATAGGAAFTLTVNGTGFVAASKVSFNGAAKSTTFVSATQISAAITAADIASSGVVNVTVTNPAPGGGTSTVAPFTINNPAPVLASLSPSTATVGGAAFSLTLAGTGFISGATVQFNGANQTTTFVNATQLTAAITASDISTAGTFKVTVSNPAPTVGPSNQLTFTVNNPVPTITGVNAAGQSHVPAGAAFTLTVNGTNFVSTSVVNFIAGTGTAKAEPTTFVSATQLTAAIPASDVASAGTASVTVTNPSPGGGTTISNTTFTIDGYTVSGPSTPPTVKAGQQSMIQITVTPSANGFANAVTFSVTGLPKNSTAVFNPTSLTPGTKASSTTLTVTTKSNGVMPPTAPVNPPTAPLLRLLPLMWLAALLVSACTMKLTRRVPQLRRYAAIMPLVLLLITGAVLAGCAGQKSGTPTGPAQLTITAASGTFQQTANVTLTVQ